MDVTNNGTGNNTYPAIKNIVKSIKDEYDYEFERTKSLDAKVNIALTLSAALLAIIYPFTNFKTVLTRRISTISDCLIPLLYILGIVITIAFLITGIFKFIRVISIHPYKRLETNKITGQKYLVLSEAEISSILITLYQNAINGNYKINEAKMKVYQEGINCVVVSIIFLIASCFIKYNLF